MNWIQDKLLLLARTTDLETTRRVDLVRIVGCEYPSQITHHINQLKKRGELTRINGRLAPAMKTTAGFLTIPVMGEADCGKATRYADGQITDSLTISPSIVNSKNHDKLFALIAKGDSMNAASIHGKAINDGDFIVVEKIDTYVPSNGDIIVSNIGGLANVKEFRKEPGRLVLLSQSSRQKDFLPIFIHENDDYLIEGRVVDVIPAVR